MAQRCRLTLWLIGLAVITGLSSGAWAQDFQRPIDSSIKITRSPLNSSQRNQIREFITAGTAVLKSEPGSEAAEQARRGLSRPLTRNNSPIFMAAYSSILASELAGLTKSDDPVARMNAYILLSYVTTESATNDFIMGLRDDSAGVRYWSARAVADVVGRMRNQAVQEATRAGLALPDEDDLYDPKDQAKLVTVMESLLKSDLSVDVRQEIYRALGQMTIRPALELLANVLEERSEYYLKNGVTEAMRAEAAGLDDLLKRLDYQVRVYRTQQYDKMFAEVGVKQAPVRAFAAAAKEFGPLIKQTAGVAGRYAILGMRAVGGNTDPQAELYAREAVKHAQSAMVVARRNLIRDADVVQRDFAEELNRSLPKAKLYLNDWLREYVPDVSVPDAFKEALVAAAENAG